MLPLTQLRTFFAPPYHLSTRILTAASVVVVLVASIYSAVAYERLGRETMESAQHWSDSVSQLVSTANVSHLVINDVAAIESHLLQVALLPGIDNIAVFRANGSLLTQAFKTAGTVRSSVGGKERMQAPLQGVKSIPGSIHDNLYESWSAMDTGAATPPAWVRVQFSLAQRSGELRRLWLQSAVATALMVGLLILGLQLVLTHALHPIRVLSRFAEQMPHNIGSHIDIAPDCIEVNQLGMALNEASRNIAEQVGRVQAIVNTAAEAIIGLNANGVVATANPTASSFFGRPESELVGNTVEHCVPNLCIRDLREMFGADNEAYAGVSRVVRQDLFGTRADGSLFPIEISLGRVPHSVDLRYVCIVRDITDEKAAHATMDLYERALACSHNAVFITNANASNQHPIVYINDAFQKMVGLPPHEVLGRSMDILRGMDADNPGVQDLALAVKNERNANVTLYRHMPDGQLQIADVSLSPIRSDLGVLTHFVGIASDVTARVQAENANSERRAQLDAIFSLSPDGFVLFDADDRMVFANPAFERMTGRRWMAQATPLDLQEFDAAMGWLCETESPVPVFGACTRQNEPWQARLQLVRPQHRVLQAQSRRNTTGRSETIIYFRDVTHEDAVDRMKSEFLAAAAHELRTPMVSIYGFTELLLKRKFSDERRTDMLETIHRQSGLLVKMINELLDLARIESRRGLDLHIGAHPLKDLIDSSIKGLMRTDTERQVTVTDAPQVTVLVDVEKMQLAMSNLLSNAFKYSPMGGEVSLNVRTAQIERRGFAVVEISDHGIGMSPDQLERAFERFYRADASGNIPGTGLGLSLVKEIADLHKGKIELVSHLGEGSTASLWIPLAA